MKSANHLAFLVSLAQIAVGHVIQGRSGAIRIVPEREDRALSDFPLAQRDQPTAIVWGQCGGISFPGPTICVSGTACIYKNPYFSQCIPIVSSITTTLITSTTTPPVAPTPPVKPPPPVELAST